MNYVIQNVNRFFDSIEKLKKVLTCIRNNDRAKKFEP